MRGNSLRLGSDLQIGLDPNFDSLAFLTRDVGETTGAQLQINPSGDFASTRVNGLFFATVTAPTSDDRIKEEEQLIENSTETLMKLRPQKYRKYQKTQEKHQEDLLKNPNAVNNSFVEAGLIAQEIYYQAPELRYIVKIDPNANPAENAIIPDDPTIDPDYGDWGEIASVDYNSLFAYLIKGFQEQQTTINDLLTRIASLESA